MQSSYTVNFQTWPRSIFSSRIRDEKQDAITLLGNPGNDQSVETVAGDDCAAVEERKDTPGPDKNVDIMIHFLIGQARLSIHMGQLGQTQSSS